MDIVVGSGPAGVSCAHALVQSGRKVLLVDSGLTLEASFQEHIDSLKNCPQEFWTGEQQAFLKSGMSVGTAGIPLKLAYGSDYPYRLTPGATPVSCHDVDSKPSYALGGLSTVWGGAVMPYKQEDLYGWPITADDLSEGYRKTLEFMPLAACEDELTRFFPLYTGKASPLPLSRQAGQLLSHLTRHRISLERNGFYAGRARLAVDAAGCRQCALCMYGCPWRIIYSSDQTLASLEATGNLIYRSGFTVRTVSESSQSVRLSGVSSNGECETIEGHRVFLAAGLLSTTAILLRSLNRYDMPVSIQDSQYFLLPMLRLRSTPNVIREPLHTLAQLYFEIMDESISQFTIHLQIYTYNELFKDLLAAKLGILKALVPKEQLLGRLFLCQGYLHSEESGSIHAILRHQGDGDELELRRVEKTQTQRVLSDVTRKLVRLIPYTGLVPLGPMLRPGLPGRGFHSGGSFPMSDCPGPGQSDRLGRPNGFTRVHVVDSTVFPSVASTTITFTSMANAWRIGRSVATDKGLQ